MDYLFSPWRYRYLEQAKSGQEPDCFFCEAVVRKDDSETLLVYRGTKNFIILNRFPYTSGHVMIVPYAHVAELALCPAGVLEEMMHLAQKTEKALKTIYSPEGINLGMNLGRAAGAGVAGHLHLHQLPRWFGDTNFMTVTAETRVHPEELQSTYKKLVSALA